MKPLPVRRRGIALVAVSIVFFGLGLSGRPHEGAYIALGAAFLVIGLAALRRAR